MTSRREAESASHVDASSSAAFSWKDRHLPKAALEICAVEYQRTAGISRHMKQVSVLCQSATKKHSSHKMLYLSLLLALLLTVHATADELVMPTDFPAAHRVIQLVDGGSWSSEFRYTLADAELVIEHRDPKEINDGMMLVLTLQKRVHLDAGNAKAAWDAIAKIGVSRWRESYRPEDLGAEIFDGTRWSVFLRIEGVEKFSSGFNVYPSLAPLGAPTLEENMNGKRMPNAYSELLSLFRTFEKK